jgi:hypothetical protein
MNDFYNDLLQELLNGARNIINNTKNDATKFESIMQLADRTIKAIEVLNNKPQVVQNVQVEEVVVEESVMVNDPDYIIIDGEMVPKFMENCMYKTKKQLEDWLEYKISDAAWEEYVDDARYVFENGESRNKYIPSPGHSIPVDAVISLYIQENPNPRFQEMFADWNERKNKKEVVEEVQEEIVEEIEIEEVVEEVEIPTDVTPENAGGEVVEEANRIKQITEKIVNDEEVSVDELLEVVESNMEDLVVEEIDPEEVLNQVEEMSTIMATINDEEFDITEQYNFVKNLNEKLTHDEILERASEMFEFGISEEVYNRFASIEDANVDLVQVKTYLGYYLNEWQEDNVVYYINYFASNIEEDDNGNEVYVNDELQLDFLNKDNATAFLEYLQQNEE